MQSDPELRDLVRAIAAHRRRGDKRYSATLRARIKTWVIARRERGDWWTELAITLGVPMQTLVRWAEPACVAGPATMKAVDVIDAPPVETVTIVAPTGLRIEGVSIDAAIAILRGIR
jgi:hypothetical protein